MFEFGTRIKIVPSGIIQLLLVSLIIISFLCTTVFKCVDKEKKTNKGQLFLLNSLWTQAVIHDD